MLGTEHWRDEDLVGTAAVIQLSMPYTMLQHLLLRANLLHHFRKAHCLVNSRNAGGELRQEAILSPFHALKVCSVRGGVHLLFKYKTEIKASDGGNGLLRGKEELLDISMLCKCLKKTGHSVNWIKRQWAHLGVTTMD